MKQFIKEYFTFNRREQRGILILLGIIVALLFCLTILKATAPTQQYDFTEFKKEIERLETTKTSDTINEENIDHFEVNKSVLKNTGSEKFNFNPNNLPEQEWRRLGFSDKQIHIIKNYESKGGKFYKKSDLKKIYGISETLYASVEPYIQIAVPNSPKHLNSETPKLLNSQTLKPLNLSIVELNSADSLQLEKLKGIGPTLAGRITKYKNKLGGFIREEQLKEVYGIDNDLYAVIIPQIIVDQQKAEKININEATIEQLKKHPYIKYKTASLIINYRNKHGLYKAVNDIKNIDVISDSAFIRIEPYLTIN